MRLFIHVNSGTERALDVEGNDYSGLESATAEAIEAAREIVRLRVRQGEVITPAWSIEIADAHGNVLERFGLGTIAFGGSANGFVTQTGHVLTFRPKASR